MALTANQILLRRRQKVLAVARTEPQATPYVATLLRNLEALGYTASAALIDVLATWPEDRLAAFQAGVVDDVRAMVGADVAWDPMYPNFPKQVMEAGEAELYLNAILHYLGDWVGLRIMPAYVKDERPALADTFDLKVIGLGDEQELCDIARKLAGARTSISETDKADLAFLIERYADNLEAALPTDITHKENLAFTTACVMRHTDRADILLTRYYKTATDVLRLATALSDGDVSLASNTVYRSFRRAERRLLLALLERCRGRVEAMLRHRGKWIRLGERLHPGEYAGRFPKTAEAFRVLRNGEKVETFGTHVEAALRDRNVDGAVALLRTRPGELARRLDHLLRLTLGPVNVAGVPEVVREQAQAVLVAFGDVVSDVATPVLLQVRSHFLHRSDPAALRAFFPKGNVARVQTVPNTLPHLGADVCEAVVAIVDRALLARFSELPDLGAVYVGDALGEHLVPFSQRSAQKALRTLVRGSSLAMPDGDTVRFFLWWKEGKVGDHHTGRVDIDLSAVMYDAQWAFKEHISYTNLRSDTYQAAHSGDITSAPDGACEFIDLHVPSVVQHGGRYVIMNVLSFTRQSFCDLPECYAGWMVRQEPGSGEIFEPATVVDKVDLAADTRICLPVVLDLVERRVYWADLALRSHPKWVVNVEANEVGVVQMGQAITTLRKPTLRELFTLHARARGHLVDDVEAADTVFDLYRGVTPFDVETIMSEYL